MQGTFTAQLRALGIAPGDVVLMHASMKALETKETPEAFLREVMAAVGDEGTLLVPALTYANVTAEQPFFSARDTQPCIGLLPRTFQRMKGVRRSLHPTHSVCGTGKHAEALLSQHQEDDTPVGPHSPFMRLMAYGGKLLFIGEVLDACTFMHGVEEIADAPYTLDEAYTHFTLEDTDGRRFDKAIRCHNFDGVGTMYRRVKDILQAPEIRSGKVGGATCYLIDARALAEKGAEVIRKEPYYFTFPIA